MSECLPERLADLILTGQRLRQVVSGLRFRSPVWHVYNPLDYAWPCYELYLRRFATPPKRVVFLGMNPGPFGMVQTGIPFGEVSAVRDWLGICSEVVKPLRQHPQRPVTGFDCRRSEISGQRLWRLFAERFGSPERFFAHHFVLNYCPLAFMERSGRNRTPDKLPTRERELLFAACDQHLKETIQVLEPEWLIGIGDFARRRAEAVLPSGSTKVGQILHPSPANPSANRAWAAVVAKQLESLGVWPKTPIRHNSGVAARVKKDRSD
jgi:single-strand selective monofunctional uracil DNA glycosylase